MFNKKKCPRCARKIEKGYDFCPYCGVDFRPEKRFRKEQDFGILGKEDSMDFPIMPNISMPGGFGSLFNSLLKEVDKQFRSLDKEMAKEKIPSQFNQLKKRAENGQVRGTGISISISTSNGNKPEIKVQGFGPDFKGMENRVKKEVKINNKKITDEEAKKFSKLPKKEADTKVRRLSNKLIYELELPGITNIKDILINKLENSIEIKAFTKDKAYFKLLPVNLPILNYTLKDEKLTLELKPSN